MRCTVLMFAQLADAVGARSLEVELADGATVADALDVLAARHDAVRELRGRIATAVGEAYVPESAPLRDGCTLALIPPVSGG